MHIHSSLAVLLISIICSATGDKLACIYGCSIPLQSLHFTGDSPEQGYYMLLCQNKLRVQSMYLCLRDRCTAKESKAGLKELGQECKEDGMTFLLPETIIDNITKQDESQMKTVNYSDLPLSGNLDSHVYQSPVLLSDELFALSEKTEVSSVETVCVLSADSCLKTVWDAQLSANFDYRLVTTLQTMRRDDLLLQPSNVRILGNCPTARILQPCLPPTRPACSQEIHHTQWSSSKE